MTEQRLLELLSAEADGQLTAEERRELEALLESSGSAKDAGESYRVLDELLRDLPSEQPPEGLSARTLQQIRLPQSATRASLANRLRAAALDGLLRYGFSAAVGALLVIAIYESQPEFNRPADLTELIGTISPNSERAGINVIDTLTVDSGSGTSTIRLENRNGALVLVVLLDSTRSIDISIDFGEAGLGFEALVQPPNDLQSIRLSNNVLRIAGSGKRHVSILLHRPSDVVPAGEAGLPLEVSSEGNLLKQGRLRLVR